LGKQRIKGSNFWQHLDALPDATAKIGVLLGILSGMPTSTLQDLQLFELSQKYPTHLPFSGGYAEQPSDFLERVKNVETKFGLVEKMVELAEEEERNLANLMRRFRE
jgi:hypothetical protein